MTDHATWADGMRRAYGVRERPERERRQWEVLLSEMPAGVKYTALAASVVADGGGRLRLSYDDLARLTGLARTTLHTAMQQAVEVGYMQRVEVRRGRGKVGSYRLVIPERTLAELLRDAPAGTFPREAGTFSRNFSEEASGTFCREAGTFPRNFSGEGGGPFSNGVPEAENTSNANDLAAGAQGAGGPLPIRAGTFSRNFSGEASGTFPGEAGTFRAKSSGTFFDGMQSAEKPSKINNLTKCKKVPEGAVRNFLPDKFRNFFAADENSSKINALSAPEKVPEGGVRNFSDEKARNFCFTENGAGTFSPIQSDEEKSNENNELVSCETSQNETTGTFPGARAHSPITNLSVNGEGGSMYPGSNINIFPLQHQYQGDIYTPRARGGGGGEGARQGTSVASPPPDPGREALARLGLTLEDYRLGLEAAAGDSLDYTSPAVAILTEPLGWLAAGADPDIDVYPVLRRSAGRGRRVRSWVYFRTAVHDALRQRREAAAAPADRNARRRALGLPDADDVLAQALAILSAPAGGAA